MSGGKKQENTYVTERRLRPIYDCLDVGNNKTALQEAEKLLKKQPELVCAKALRALALIRLSRFNEATSLLSEIEQQEPDEEYTLQALTYCYRDLGEPERIITLYERATKKDPQNEEYLSHLMMAYVRVGEHKKQNRIAMQLYKLRPAKNPYYFWSVMSTVMQAYEDPKLSRTMYLPLAQRMIEKFLDSDKLNAEAEVKLYVLILEMQEKYAEAVGVLQGPMMSRFVKYMWESNQKIVELLEKLARWQEVFDMCENLLRKPENIDDWFLWDHLFTAGFQIIKEDAVKKSSIIEKLTTAVLNTKSSSGHFRGPYLARLRLIACLLERDYVVRSELGEPRDLVIDYFRRFGDRPSLFDDIKPYLWLLGEEQQNNFIDELEQACGGDLPIDTSRSSYSNDDPFAQDVKIAYKHQAGLQLARCLGRYADLSPEQKQDLATDLVRRYENALRFGTDLSPAEHQPADGYLLLALHTIWDIYLDVGDMKVIFEMILLAERGIERSPSNFRVKSMLVKLYSLVGGGACLLRVCESMDVKYILRDALWYLVCDNLSPWGLYGDLLEWTHASLTFYAQSEKEIIDCVVQCYKSGSFAKILEFFDFRNRLRNSFHIHACRVWRKYFSLINDGDSLDAVVSLLKESPDTDLLKDSRKWSTYRDNSDYSIIACCDTDQVEKAAEAKRRESYQQLMDQLRFYQLLLALLSCLSADGQSERTHKCSIDNGSTSAEPVLVEPCGAATSATVSSVLNEFLAHCKYCRNIYSSSDFTATSTAVLHNPVSGYFGLYLHGSYADVLVAAVQSACSLTKAITTRTKADDDDGTSPPSADESSKLLNLPSADEIQQLLKAMFSAHQLHGGGGGGGGAADEPDGFPFMQIVHISFLVQTLSLVLTAFSLTLRRAQEAYYNNRQQQATNNSTTKEKKQKKKNKGAGSGQQQKQALDSEVAQDPLIAEFLQFAAIFCQAAETTIRLIEDLEMLLEADVSQCSLRETRFVPADMCAAKSDTVSKLENSYRYSMKELQRVMSQNLANFSPWCRGSMEKTSSTAP